MIALFLSGLTAIPLERELSFLSRCFSPQTPLGSWIDKVYMAVANMNKQYPFLAGLCSFSIGYSFYWPTKRAC